MTKNDLFRVFFSRVSRERRESRRTKGARKQAFNAMNRHTKPL